MPSKTLTSRPSDGGWNRTTSPKNRWYDGARIENETDSPNLPIRYRQRENISDAAKERAETHAERVNSKAKTLTREELDDAPHIDVRRAAGVMQALSYLAEKRLSVIKK